MSLVTTRLVAGVVLLLLAAPLAPAAAQPREKVPQVGFLGPRTRSNDAGFVDAFRARAAGPRVG